MNSDVFIHPTALVSELAKIGKGTRIWAFANIQDGVEIGENCNICDGVFIEKGVSIGNGCTIKNGVYLWADMKLGDNVFVGPNVTFTNDEMPRSHPDYITLPNDWQPNIIGDGATIGAGAVLLPGVSVAEWAFVAAGAVVTSNVPPYTLVKGVPAKEDRLICRCGSYLIKKEPYNITLQYECCSCDLKIDLTRVPPEVEQAY